MGEKKKVIIIGWDGATYDNLAPLIKKGYLPNLKKMISRGASGIMNSVDPPYTGPAWSTLAMGVNPGKHGQFGWKERYSKSDDILGFERKFRTSELLRGKNWMSYLSESGLKQCIFNFPMIYPPEPIQGCFISGLLAPSVGSSFTYPTVEKDKILGMEPDYQTDISYKDARNRNLERYYKQLIDSLNQKIKMAKYYWEREQWDLFFATFVETDCYQHVFWHTFDPEHPQYTPEINKKWGNTLVEIYSKLDDFLGYILDKVRSTDLCLLLSDHGFGPAHYRVHINKLLKEKKLLSTEFVEINSTVYERINWEKTKAYAGDTYEQCIYLNVKGRDEFGIIDTDEEYQNTIGFIKELLNEIRDPWNNSKIVIKTLYNSEAYAGKYASLGPDVIYETKNGLYLHSNTLSPESLIEKATWQTGCHRKQGIFVMNGFDVKRSTGFTVELTDLFPTILDYFNLSIPDHIEGKVIKHKLLNESSISY